VNIFFLDFQLDCVSLPSFVQVHTSDLLNVYFNGELTDYLIRFVATLDPNGSTGAYWPKYTTQSPNLLTFLDGLIPVTITQDTYRRDAIDYMITVTLSNPL